MNIHIHIDAVKESDRRKHKKLKHGLRALVTDAAIRQSTENSAIIGIIIVS